MLGRTSERPGSAGEKPEGAKILKSVGEILGRTRRVSERLDGAEKPS